MSDEEQESNDILDIDEGSDDEDQLTQSTINHVHRLFAERQDMKLKKQKKAEKNRLKQKKAEKNRLTKYVKAGFN